MRGSGLAALVGAMVMTLGCPGREVEPDDGAGATGDDAGATDTGTTDTGDDASSSSVDETGGPPPIVCDEIEPGGLVPEELDLPADCTEPLDNCQADHDRDGVHISCDNAPEVANPAQRDADADEIGDAMDLCPVVAGVSDTTLDSDRDGFGNACDVCPQTVSDYRAPLEAAGVPFAMWIRSVPSQHDMDADGVGDVCDNCPTVPNCGDFGPDAPATVLDEPPIEDPTACQTDSDADGIGDACEDLDGDDAAGPVGFAPSDDFDRDGIVNADDACPRLWLAAVTCADDADCGDATQCASGVCDHVDADGDGIGDACDTCPGTPNPEQIADADGEAADDEDRDFIGAACETHEWCIVRADPRPLAFFDVVADGVCCVRTWPGDGVVLDPDGTPLHLDCTGVDGPCREVPADVAGTTTTLSVGCEAALAAACKEEASPVTLDDVGGDLVAWWQHACQLLPRDPDLDGIGSTCDLCEYAHDPDNTSYVDTNGMEWPQDGAYCNGDYDESLLDPTMGCQPGT